MNKKEIVGLQKRIGTEPDGFWGPLSTRRAKDYLYEMMPRPHPFPKQRDVTDFYGPFGVKGGYTPPMKKIGLPFHIYYGSRAVTYLLPHEKCADSLLCVFQRIDQAFNAFELLETGFQKYDGIYNPRNMRGGASKSMHALAIAIDNDSGRNGNKSHWPVASHMPIEIFECFAKEGWTSAGAWWSRDAMHHQATNPR